MEIGLIRRLVKGYNLNSEDYLRALYLNDQDALRFLIRHNCPRPRDNIMDIAILSQDLRLVLLLYSDGYSFSSLSYYLAVRDGSMDIVRAMVSLKYKEPAIGEEGITAYKYAKQAGDMESIKYILAHRQYFVLPTRSRHTMV